MKELSIEDKAKRYDEAIERAKSWYVDAQIDFKKSLETLFPELKESEDERIKKNIITLAYDALDKKEIEDKEYKEICAWLKKQGEQKPAWSEWDEEILSEIIDFFENGTVKLQHDLSLYASWLKSIKQRYTWKPSDGQIEILEHFVRSIGESGYASPYDNNTKLLYSLLSDLKKLREE